MDDKYLKATSSTSCGTITTGPSDSNGRQTGLGGVVTSLEPGTSVKGVVQATGRLRTLLLVDDEENIIASLRRLLRRDGYRILTANSGQDGLELLACNEVDVIISDNRMPSMTGVEFLRRAKQTWPDCVRIMLSGYTESQSIVDAINECAIFKFLTKPWEDESLRVELECAFDAKASADEDRRLLRKLAATNVIQAELNTRLAGLLAQQPIAAAHKRVNWK